MKKDIEILVIGAGPAGLSAAIEAAKCGAEVLVVAHHHTAKTFRMKIISLAGSYLNRFINSLVQEDIKQEPEVSILEHSC